jgi:hypothetical protein
MYLSSLLFWLSNQQLPQYMGLISKEGFDAAFCAHQAAVDATKSLQREEAQTLDHRRQS